ncbi:MAG: DHHA1 domain-containing protein, partial [Myxococcales bacterium]|nr:DHHA1 domain-containing protein [Myxococcales bacterium]
ARKRSSSCRVMSSINAARARSQGSKVGEQAVDAVYKELADSLPATEFVGYETEQAESEVLALIHDRARVEQLEAGAAGAVVVGSSPFYAESGGQVGDCGQIAVGDARFLVEDTLKPRDGLWVHRGKLEDGTLKVGDRAQLEVDGSARSATRRNHSATHLMHLALREVVGPQAMQKGSLVGPDRLRFDYSASTPLSEEQIARIEDMVVERVMDNVEVTTDVLPMDAAKERGAIGIFEEKYGDVVRMLTIADSIELCGGTHVQRTGDIGAFKILSDSGIAAGVRRIEAATGDNALQYTRSLEQELGRAAALLRGSSTDVAEKVQKMIERQKELARQIDDLKKKLISGGSGDLTADAREIDGVKVLGALVDVGDPGALRELADQLRDKLAPAVVALGSPGKGGKALLVCTVSSDLTKRFQAGKLIKELASVVGGGGGGRPDFAQAGGNDPSKLGAAVERVYELVSGA